MIRPLFIPAVLAVTAVPHLAQAQPRCEVTIVRAPDAIRAEIEAAVRAESRCTTSLEVRVLETEGKIYLFARDSRGFTRERMLPDGSAVGALVASWIADDAIDGVWLPDTLTIEQLTAFSTRAPGYHDPIAPPAPNAPGRALRLTGLAVAGAGVVAAGLGIYWGMKVREDSDFISNYRAAHPGDPWPDNIFAIEARGRHNERVEWVSLTSAGVLVAGGAALYLIGRSQANTEKARIVPTASPGGAGVSFGGSF